MSLWGRGNRASLVPRSIDVAAASLPRRSAARSRLYINLNNHRWDCGRVKPSKNVTPGWVLS
jgi:hypothetical protein